MIGFLSHTLGRWKLRNRFAKTHREPEAIHLSKVKSAVILFCVRDENHYREIWQVAEILQEQKGVSDVLLLAFYGEKDVPSFVNRQKVEVFGKKEVSLCGIPKTGVALSVLRKEFDLLLDFTQESFLPTDFFLALLNAKSKVGVSDKVKNEYLDLILDIPSETSVLDKAKNMFRYLEMLNKE